MLFGEKVKLIAAEKGLKQKDIVIRSGINKQTVSKIWTNQTTDPRAGTFLAIAEALGVTPMDLFEDVDFVKDSTSDDPRGDLTGE